MTDEQQTQDLLEGFHREHSVEGGMDDLAAAFYKQAKAEGMSDRLPPAEPRKFEAAPPEPEPAPAPEEEEEEAPAEEAAPAVEGDDAPEEIAAADEEDVELVDMGDGNKIPLTELVRGHLRQADYTKKTQELAEQRKALAAEKAQFNAQFAAAGQQIAELAEKLNEQLKQEGSREELEALRKSDPAEYSARIIELQEKQRLVEAAQRQQEVLYQQQRYEIVMRERAALQAKNEKFADNFDTTYEELTRWVTSPEGGGLPPEMWDQVYDHRAVLLAYKAMQQDRTARTEAPKIARKLATLPKVIRPGRKIDPGQTVSKDYEQAKEQARESGRLEDLAAAFAKREQLKRQK